MAKIPVLIVSGYAAAGKTRMLRMALKDLAAVGMISHRHAAEFGIATGALPANLTIYREVFDFGSGCLCCSPTGDLVRALLDILRSGCLLDLLVLRLGPLASPLVFAKAVHSATEEVRDAFYVASIVTIVEASLAQKHLSATSPEWQARLQVLAADLIVVASNEPHQDHHHHDDRCESHQQQREALQQRGGDDRTEGDQHDDGDDGGRDKAVPAACVRECFVAPRDATIGPAEAVACAVRLVRAMRPEGVAMATLQWKGGSGSGDGGSRAGDAGVVRLLRTCEGDCSPCGPMQRQRSGAHDGGRQRSAEASYAKEGCGLEGCQAGIGAAENCLNEGCERAGHGGHEYHHGRSCGSGEEDHGGDQEFEMVQRLGVDGNQNEPVGASFDAAYSVCEGPVLSAHELLRRNCFDVHHALRLDPAFETRAEAPPPLLALGSAHDTRIKAAVATAEASAASEGKLRELVRTLLQSGEVLRLKAIVRLLPPRDGEDDAEWDGRWLLIDAVEQQASCIRLRAPPGGGPVPAELEHVESLHGDLSQSASKIFILGRNISAASLRDDFLDCFVPEGYAFAADCELDMHLQKGARTPAWARVSVHGAALLVVAVGDEAFAFEREVEDDEQALGFDFESPRFVVHTQYGPCLLTNRLEQVDLTSAECVTGAYFCLRDGLHITESSDAGEKLPGQEATRRPAPSVPPRLRMRRALLVHDSVYVKI